MNRFITFLFLVIISISCKNSDSIEKLKNGNFRLLSVKEYQEAVYASWLGQIVGNTYGLGYEFKYIDEPGPDSFPYGYSWTLEDLKKYNGAYSDDDTDIEYMYLTQMEKYGIEPGYFHLAEAWKTHVKERVWCANRQAVALMHAGYYPPQTGALEYNHQWSQIDPQLVNEIWSITAPGMISYAVDKSAYMAKITNDSFGIEPTLHYAAMYSAAFFEKDIVTLIDIGTRSLEKNSRFSKVVEHVKQLYTHYPNDWKKARKIVKDTYMVQEDYNNYAWPVIDAQLNGALGIMALLYGEGDFQKTLDYCCAFGMDADNQAATMCGLLGIINGLDSIPEELLFPIEDADWVKPFNDSYKMITREGLSDAKITDLAERIALQGEKIIMALGGKKVITDGEEYFLINSAAQFTLPFELNSIPKIFIEKEQFFEYPIYTGGIAEDISVFPRGDLPQGIKIENNKMIGVPVMEGSYNFEIVAQNSERELSTEVSIIVHSQNIAPEATEIIFNKNAIDSNIQLINDGSLKETFYSIKNGDKRELDYYGYIWNEPKEISAISFNPGVPHEFGGWFTSFWVEYLKNDTWTKVENIAIFPEMNLDNSQWLKPAFVEYNISFPKITSTGIRVVGVSGGIEKDAANAHLGKQFYTSISELKIFAE